MSHQLLKRTFEKENGDIFGLLKGDPVDSEDDPLGGGDEGEEILVEQKSHLDSGGELRDPPLRH